MTPEDEAFDELAKRQGDWGGGFQAKRRMAADKLQEPICPECQTGVLYECVACSRNNYPTQREWVGLTNDEVNNFAAGCHLGKSVQGAIYEAEAKLKEKNFD